MQLEELQDGQKVRYRLGREGNAAIDWQPWKDGELQVQRNSKGEVVLISPRGESWAEYVPGDFDSGVFLAEDRYMELNVGTSKDPMRSDLLMVLKRPGMYGVDNAREFETLVVGYELAADPKMRLTKALTKWCIRKYVKGGCNWSWGSILEKYSLDWNADLLIFLNDWDVERDPRYW